MKQTAEQVGLTPGRVRRLGKKALAQLRSPERHTPRAAWAGCDGEAAKRGLTHDAMNALGVELPRTAPKGQERVV
ncbi:hypothetical protein [Streptomyces sp. NBC_00996]|uniref:hypothetical protein n=1 Tax=Streptomyces sp. NBC_00996 TaxID=2903710 RepID=UPI003866E18C